MDGERLEHLILSGSVDEQLMDEAFRLAKREGYSGALTDKLVKNMPVPWLANFIRTQRWARDLVYACRRFLFADLDTWSKRLLGTGSPFPRDEEARFWAVCVCGAALPSRQQRESAQLFMVDCGERLLSRSSPKNDSILVVMDGLTYAVCCYVRHGNAPLFKLLRKHEKMFDIAWASRPVRDIYMAL